MNDVDTTLNLVRVNGRALACQIRGGGRPLVMLHGGFGSLEMFGANVDLLAQDYKIIGVDLHSHGRTPAIDEPMRFETMADDIAALIRELGETSAAVLGFSLGGSVALRTAIQHSDVVDHLILVSTPFRRSGWHSEMTTSMDAMGPEFAEQMKQTPLFTQYEAIAPRVEDWPVLVRRLTDLMKVDYDWSDEVAQLSMPTLLIVGDSDGLPPAHAVEFFGLLGGGLHDANWDRSGMTAHRLAVIPGATHYDINGLPDVARVVKMFLG
ncbi:MAG TPA: alpha/beta hydrolase [Chloroflexota bacterium]|nr:alpha/beta hydrolase [Chloroflexota bacterium]